MQNFSPFDELFNSIKDGPANIFYQGDKNRAKNTTYSNFQKQITFDKNYYCRHYILIRCILQSYNR